MNIFNLTSLKSIGLSFGLLVGTVVSAQQNPDVENNLNRIEDPVHHSHSGNLAEGEKEFFNFVNSKPNFNDSYEAARFIENKGQWNSNVLFRTELVDGAIFFEKNKLKYQFVDGNGFYDALHGGESEYTIKTHALEVDFVNASDEVKISRAVSFAQHNQSYFYGNGKQASNVKFYQEVTYENLYEGITVVYHSFNDHLKYDVRVAQGADPNQFVMNYDGAEHIFIDENGNLIIETTLSGIAEFAPYTYQIINGVETKVESRYVLNGTEVSFEFPNGYDTNEELIIDPSLVASTYTGSTSDNWGFTAGHTAGGEMVVAGAASGAGYPTTIGAFQTTWNGATTFPTGGLAADITVSIFSADGTTLISSSYLGGTNFETAHSLQVDQLTGDVYILGKTRSTDFPTTITAFDQTHNGGTSDIFITRLNSTLSVLTASTFVGGSGVDGANVDENFAGTANTKFSYGDAHRGQIVFDSAGDLYVVSSTQSTDFPTSVGALDATLGGTQDVVVFKMDNLLTGLIYSTYLGGTAIDAGMGIAVDPSGNAYVTGATEGGGFPATAGTIDNTYNGNVDGFLTLLNATGTANTATTFLGTTAKDGGFYVDLDEANDPVVFGLSLGGTYPTTVGVYTDANSRQFVHGLSADLTTTNFSTIYGTSSGTPSINPTGFQVDSCGKIICGGWGRSFDGSTSTGLVTTGGAYQTTTDGSDFHFAVLGVNATSLVYATFVGENGGVGDHVDGGSSTFDDKGIIYQAVCASCGGTNGFPTTAGASSSTNNAANCNNAVFKFDLDTYAPNAAGIAAVGVGCLGIPVTFTNTSGGAVSYEWNFGDGSPVSTATNPSHTYTATGTYTVQLVAFNPTACITSDTTSITIDIDQPNVTVSTNPASGTICNGDNVTMTAAGANTYTWTPGPFTGNPYVQSPTTTTTYEVIGADANGCEDTVQVTITVDPVPTGANAGTDQTVCETPGTATLAGNTPVTGTGIWTLTSGTGTITTPSSPTSGVTGLGVGANVFSWTITNGVCAASSDDVTINVDADATIADAGLDQTQCETITTATLSGNTPTSGTGVWTVIAGGATVTTPASPTSGVTGLTTGTNTFEWTITNGTCTPSTDQITITLDAAPTGANAGTDQTVCETPGTATLAGNTPVTGTGIWTLTSGTGTITTPSSPTSGVTGLGVGANVFTWTTSNGTCPTSSDDVTINVDADATIADAGTDQTQCETITTATLSGNTPTSGTGVWTVIAGGATVTTPASPTSGVTGLTTGTNTFEWTITNGTCTPTTDQITITLDAAPTAANAGTDQTVCETPGTATLAGNTPAIGTGTWTLTSGTGTITTPASPTSGLTGLGVGANVFTWTTSNGTCPTSSDDVTINVDADATIADAGLDQTQCETVTTATLSGNTPTSGTGVWTVIAGGATVTTPASPTSGVIGLTTGTNTFEWTITNGTCTPSTDQITITLDAAPTAANAGTDQTVCETPGTATLAGNTPAVGTGTWTLTSGTGIITTPSSPTSGLTGLGVGANVFTWTTSNGTCPTSSDDVTINVDADATIADAGLDQTQCETITTATLSGNTPTSGTGVWTVIAGGATVTTPASPTSGVTGLTTGTNTFEWTITNGTCTPTTDQITITLDAAPTAANAGTDQTVCETPGTATLAGNTPAVGTGTWTLTSGTGTITTPSSPTSGLTGLGVGANVFTWTTSNGTCPTSSDDVTINVDADATIADAGTDQTQCETITTATLSGNTPTSGTGVWTVIAGGATITTPASPTSGVTGLTAGTNTFEWTITNGTCTPTTDQITITLDAAPTAANAGTDQTVCETPGTATLAGNTPVTGTGTWTLTSGTGTITTPSSPTSGLTGLGVGANVFTWTTSNGTCPTSSDDVTINVDADATIADAGADQDICVDNTTLAGNIATSGTGVWTLVSGSGTITTPSSPTSGVTGLGAGANVFEWTITNGTCAPSTDQVTINVTPDTDGDLVCDGVDEDDDNDGIPDVAENPGDSDGDGIPDSLDLDSDNDGIPDIIEAGGTDADGDGEVDYPVPGDPSSMTDVDGDGVDDNVDPSEGGTALPNPDSDGDGVNDATDLDADNDGTPDIVEAGGTDADGDGQVDGYTDVDGDGFADINDTDDNTVPGTGDGGTPLANPDSDNDGVVDVLDLDSDNDGIADIVENGGTDTDGDGQLDGFTDVDGDGFGDDVDTDDNTVPGTADGGTNLPGGDFDQDGIPNNLDLDSDNDGITDANEAGGADTDGDGILDGFADVDGDGFSDVVDTDDNTVPGTNDGGTTLPTPNTDGTGNADYLDIDADDDGIIDNIEGQTTAGYNPPLGTDSDNDGIDDQYDPDNAGNIIIPNDHDGDSTPDYQDLDSDNDGESDLLEGHDLNGNGIIDGAEVAPANNDADGDGLDDAFDTVVLSGGTSGTNGGNGTVDPATDGTLADADNPTIGDLDFREFDTDGDGVDNSIDEDDDNDGIPDVAENPGDSDGDGIPDSLDLDSDNDGIPDIIEAGGTDADGDGEVDYPVPGDPSSMTDVDGDGIDDNVDPSEGGTALPNPDSDGDGVNDATDLDADNDGTPDIVEAGGTDADGDGQVDGYTDVDGDGFADINDTDDNTVPGTGDGGTPLANPDSDNDGVVDVLDLDSDNDGIADIVENGGTDTDGDGQLDGFTDVDGDGFGDAVDTDDNTVPGTADGGTNLPGGDFDQDGIPNNLDLDSDNDGITDANEAGGADTDGDGILDGFADVDGDGFSDVVDTDDNTVPGTNDGGTTLPTPNTDGTGNADYLDIDADDDGIIDNIEGQTTAGYNPPLGTDSDNDGIDDQYDPDNAGNIIIPNDHDGDSTPDYQDLDSDNDGESDLLEGHDLNGNGVIDGAEVAPANNDADGDGLDDAFDTVVLSGGTSGTNGGNGTVDPATDGTLADADSPLVGDLDFREADSDGDGIDDATDEDDDNDGIPDVAEGTGDTDGDGIPDSLDLDSDNDGIPDIIEAGGTDADGDGEVDYPVPGDPSSMTDVDGDGVDDNVDPSEGGTALPNPDSDGDGVNDVVDLDADNDGIPDVIEAGGTDVDGDGVLDGYVDVDGDGFNDTVDSDDNTNPGTGDLGTPLPNGDADQDGVPNNLDVDSDNDGITDATEAGGTDLDGDGQLDGFTDVDGDGFTDVTDTDDNTVPGTADGGTSLPMPNTDGTGGVDYLDIDADGDGIPDNVEGQTSLGYTAPTGTDTDGDGLDDAYDTDNGGTPITPVDTDIDGTEDYLDLDSDNDGESDLLEGHDLNGNGVIDGAENAPANNDADGDGLDDNFDTVVLSGGTSGTNAGNGTTDPLTDGTFADADNPGVGNLDFREIDNDGDGIDDSVDEDDDNDGIPDVAEGTGDTDGDGIPDSLDLDSDNDGIPDIIEAGGTDADGDGEIDYPVPGDPGSMNDTDGDGLDDSVDPDNGGTPLANPDSDGDGVNDVLDLDADNDGTPDAVEAGGTDADGDGILDGYVDVDGDGFNDTVDSDDNTVPGTGDGGTPLANPDSDNDGVVDVLDLDSDNDGIADIVENGGTDTDGDGQLDGFTDVDGDGFGDAVDTDDNTVPGTADGGTNLPGGDFDQDGIPNNLDLDSDNDGITDANEAGGTDADGDGILDGFADVDGDGFSDVVDTDDNTVPGTNDGGTTLPTPNTDGTGNADYLDIDADDDGIIDNIEGQTTAGYNPPLGTDSDNDGIDDQYDPDNAGNIIIPNDHDGDSTPDYQDLDSDNDGESDLLEGHDLNGNGVIDGAEVAPANNDADGDGLDDNFDTVVLSGGTSGINGGNGTVDPATDGTLADADSPLVGDLDFRESDNDGDGIDDAVDEDDDNDGIPDVAENPGDTDGDGIPDIVDLDSDNDGIPDIIEAGGTDVDGDGQIDYPVPGDPGSMNDTDGDGLDDSVDPDNGGTPLPNPDTDGDGVADVNDLDSDNDGTPDVIEAGGTDVDGDGHIDGFTDNDNDGFDDAVDTDDNTTPGTGDGGTALPNPDTDNDGVNDVHDLDSDNDGIPDVIENGGADADGDGILDGYSDVDGDGYSDVVDSDDDTVPGTNDGGTPLPNGDFDMDGIPNAQDVDSDNDGITDATEAGGVDVDGDGILDGFADVDGDGFSDIVDTDDNTVPGTNDGGTSLPVPNTDGSQGDDYLDIDSDNDGIPDNVEGQTTAGYNPPSGTDTDGDGLDDEYDPDNTGNIIIPTDTDFDGTPDYTDLDSDNDGEDDLTEGHDLNGNGVIDGSETAPSGNDTDGDGLDDAFDTEVLTTGTANTNAANGTTDPFTDGVFADADNPGIGDLDWRELDTDGDGISDYVDLDDDNDGIPDLLEDLDADMDGNPYTNPTDTDNDGIPDIWDLDSDNDGIPDIVEAGGTDANNDGRVDDLNVDGTLINDTDNDGLDDLYDGDNGGTDIPNPDTDGDGHNDFQDVDSDNDGIYDIVEDGGFDNDNDGQVDDWADADGDQIPDYADADATGGTDVDGDGIDDSVDVDFTGGTDMDGDGIDDTADEDPDGDGWDNDDATAGDEDTDGDGIPDYQDLDSDNDGTPDIVEDGGTDADGDGMIDDFNDTDGDGADDDDMTDGQDDVDGDGIPDHEDLDSDNDGITDANENGKPDVDGDGVVDDFTDTDGDGWDDVNGSSDPTDTDGDGIPDQDELDSDNDGIPDIIEGGDRPDVDGDGMVDDFTDTDGDGLDDNGGSTPPDTDGDGVPDYQDQDSDDDGVPDSDENDPDGDGQGPDDTDGDGIPDYLDIDDDNDGILTADELDNDTNGDYDDCDEDGLPDYLDADACGLEIPEGFSPNDDGVNDLFVIKGIGSYPDATITIYNRWGNKVYESINGYANDWDGHNLFGMTTKSRALPAGTYFYVLDLGDGSEVIKGYVYLNR